MHVATSILFILGVLTLLIAGLVRVLHDLLEQGPHAAPIDDEALVPVQPLPLPEPRAGRAPHTARGWNGERSPR
jgi:hypothetical protein